MLNIDMAEIYKNILNNTEVSELLDYHSIDDDRTDSRETVRSKHPRWAIDLWPKTIVKKVLDSVLEKDYTVEEVIFNQSRISFQLHADSGYNTDASKPYKAVLLPLYCENGKGSTAFFNNFWHGEAAKFTRAEDPYGAVKDKKGQLSTKDQRVTDYSKVENYNNRPFDRTLYEEYFQHIPYENLHGLSLEQIANWQPGDAIVFDRTQIHSATSEHSEKIGITIFTQLA